MPPTHRLTVAAGAGERLDRWVVGQGAAPSRAAVQRLIEGGRVRVDGRPARASYRVRLGDEIEVDVPDPAPVQVAPEPIPLDVLYEDADVIVVNKPRGMVVHPAPGNPSGTLVHALLAHCADLSGVGGELRPGIVHRLDKDTSGVMVVAKHDHAHIELARQLKEKTAGRIYLALVHGDVKSDAGTIDQPIGRHPVQRKRMAVVAGGRRAVTHYRVLRRLGSCTLLECALETGRTHQIRVHLAHSGHPVVGDPVYGPRKIPWRLAGQALHAHRLTFRHPRTGRAMSFVAPLPADMERILADLADRARRAGD